MPRRALTAVPPKDSELTALRSAFLSFLVDDIDRIAQEALRGGVPPRDLLEECRQGMGEIGRKFETGEYYLPELVVAGEMFKIVSARAKPLLKGGGRGNLSPSDRGGWPRRGLHPGGRL